MLLLLAALSSLSAPGAAQDADRAPPVSLADALACRLDAPVYNGFAASLQDDETGYRSLGWERIEAGAPTYNFYRLPAPLQIDGRTTQVLAFSASGIFAVLDEPDIAALAKQADIPNTLPTREELAALLGLNEQQAKQLPQSSLFKGEKVVRDNTASDPELGRVHTRNVRIIENDPALPGKVFDGCSYSVEFPDL